MSDSCAFWRLPGENSIHVIEGIAKPAGSAKGLFFAMHSFDAGTKSFDIEAVSHQVCNASELPEPGISDIASYTGGDSHTRETYMQLVEQALQEIASGRVQKIVASRCKQFPKPVSFNTRSYFLALCEAYPSAFVALVTHGALCWICASPEILLKLEDRTGYTVALAGTRSAADTEPFSGKEYLEQQLVQFDIESGLRHCGLSYSKTAPAEIQAGNLRHLFTGYTIDSLSPGKADELVGILHPTPAVAGQPREAALGFLRQHEGYDRSYYSGYLGPVMPGGNRYMYVNLRCMRVWANTLLLYAGAGINEGSVPEKEWQETENKLKTLAGLL